MHVFDGFLGIFQEAACYRVFLVAHGGGESKEKCDGHVGVGSFVLSFSLGNSLYSLWML